MPHQLQHHLILADTSVWIDHLRSENKDMRRHLKEGRIVTHPLIVAELRSDPSVTALGRSRYSTDCRR